MKTIQRIVKTDLFFVGSSDFLILLFLFIYLFLISLFPILVSYFLQISLPTFGNFILFYLKLLLISEPVLVLKTFSIVFLRLIECP